jgi:hypothetical protein
MKRWLFILARALDYRIGLKDKDKPDLPILTFQEAVVSFTIRLIIVFVQFITCFFVVANILRHW